MPVLSQDLLKLIADKSSMSFQAYAEAIAFQPIEKLDPDPLFQEAVIEEFATLGYTDKAAQGFLQHKTLQTSHHLTPTLGPSFLGGDCLALVSSTTPYYVGAYTAVPLNNSAWSGSLSFLETELFTIVQPDSHYYRVLKKNIQTSLDQGAKEKKVHLIPTKAQNSLVYGLKTPIETYQIYDALQPTLQKAWPRPSSEEYYSDWALKICTHVQRVIFDKPEIYYFDLNRLVSRYFIKLLSQKKLNNPYLWLFTQNNNLLASSGLNLGWFKNPADSYQKIFTPLDGWIDHPEKVLEDFISYNFVPSLFLVFSLLSFHLGIRVYGSYAQYEYYPTIGIWHENLWRQAGFDYKPSELSQNRFGYARLPSEITRFSLDYYTQGRKVNLSSLAKLPMQVFWASLL